MRVLAMLAIALSMAGCTGDRIKQGTNLRQVRPPGAAQFADAHRIRNIYGEATSIPLGIPHLKAEESYA
jgi:hypothetical protein